MPVSNYRIAALSSGVLAASTFALMTTPAHAQVVVFTTPFTGTATESFESFPNAFQDPNFYRTDPTSIFGGAGFLSGDLNAIYEPSQGVTFGLGSNGQAQVADGTKGLGGNSSDYTFTFTFNNAQTQFGGFFNAASGSGGGDDDTVTFTFRDASNAVIDTKVFDVNPSGTTDGALNFYGFTSSTAFSSVSVTGDFVVADSLRIGPGRVAAIPEPSEYAAMGMAGFALCGLMLRARRRTRDIGKGALEATS